ncbi:lysine--tRNA ligase, partial [Listeria monocytogenes]
MSEEMNDQMQVRRQKLQEFLDLGIVPFGHLFDRSATSNELKEQWVQFSLEELHDIEDEIHVAIAGRFMPKRGQVIAGFAYLQDLEGQIQI